MSRVQWQEAIFLIWQRQRKKARQKHMLYQKSHLSNVVFRIHHSLSSYNTKVLGRFRTLGNFYEQKYNFSAVCFHC
jgi:hypothetical protein